MDFDATKISDLTSSLQYLINSMLNTGKYLSRGELLAGKPSWLSQTERFSSFFERIKENDDLIEGFRNKFALPLYNRYSVNLNSKLIDSENKVQDAYIKIKINNSNDFKLKTEPEGIYLNIDRFFLPISEAYSRVLVFETKNKEQNNLYATCILIGMYSVLYHAALPEEGKESLDGLHKNIELLVSALDILDKPSNQAQGGPMSMLKSFMDNMDLEPIKEMMSSITGDDQANGNLGEVLMRMGKSVENGGNPFDMMSEMIKEASAQAAQKEDEDDVEPEDTVEDLPALESVVEESEEKIVEISQ
jgi:hypothetical protein